MSEGANVRLPISKHKMYGESTTIYINIKQQREPRQNYRLVTVSKKSVGALTSFTAQVSSSVFADTTDITCYMYSFSDISSHSVV